MLSADGSATPIRMAASERPVREVMLETERPGWMSVVIVRVERLGGVVVVFVVFDGVAGMGAEYIPVKRMEALSRTSSSMAGRKVVIARSRRAVRDVPVASPAVRMVRPMLWFGDRTREEW